MHADGSREGKAMFYLESLLYVCAWRRVVGAGWSGARVCRCRQHARSTSWQCCRSTDTATGWFHRRRPAVRRACDAHLRRCQATVGRRDVRTAHGRRRRRGGTSLSRSRPARRHLPQWRFTQRRVAIDADERRRSLVATGNSCPWRRQRTLDSDITSTSSILHNANSAWN